MNTLHLFLYYIIPLLLVLGVLIFFHELGHFLFAKFFNVKVLRFSLGFGPKVMAKQIGETEYAISIIPFGGYVKMLGEDLSDETLPPRDEYRAFNKQPVLTRMIIVLAGPFFNLLLALIIFIMFYAIVGVKVVVPEVGKVKRNSPAEKAGFKPGDVIISMNGIPVKRWRDIREIVHKEGSIPIITIIKRGENLCMFEVTPEKGKVKNIFGEEIETFVIGIVASGKTKILKVGFIGAIKEGFRKTLEITKLTCITVVKLVERIVPVKVLGGPILIGQITGKIAQQNWIYLIPFTAVISVNLGILNLLPVPILDGGLILFLIIELIIGRPLNQKVLETIHKIGLILLISLTAMVIYNDIVRILTKG